MNWQTIFMRLQFIPTREKSGVKKMERLLCLPPVLGAVSKQDDHCLCLDPGERRLLCGRH